MCCRRAATTIILQASVTATVTQHRRGRHRSFPKWELHVTKRQKRSQFRKFLRVLLYFVTFVSLILFVGSTILLGQGVREQLKSGLRGLFPNAIHREIDLDYLVYGFSPLTPSVHFSRFRTASLQRMRVRIAMQIERAQCSECMVSLTNENHHCDPQDISRARFLRDSTWIPNQKTHSLFPGVDFV